MNGKPFYSLGRKYVTSLKELAHQMDDEEDKAVRNFQENEKLVKDSYKKRLEALQNYYSDLNKDCKIKGESNRAILEK